MTDRIESRPRRLARLGWPWLVLILAVLPAIVHFLAFEHERDGEYPMVARPTFSPRPPAAYRLAEPGDTIDRIGLYASAVVAVMAATGGIVARRASLWPAALALSLAAGWFSATPGPGFDGWHGLGWRAISDPSAPPTLRIALGLAAVVLLGVVVGSILAQRPRWRELWTLGQTQGAAPLLVAATILVSLRGVDVPGTVLAGYWPRWAFAWGMIAFGLALVKLAPAWPNGLARWGLAACDVVAVWGLIAGGIALFWYHRPLERLRAVVPGRIYISAMPSYGGLKIEQERLHFKTIINLFPEDTDRRSPILHEEERFVRECGIQYVRSPGLGVDSDKFLDETLALARDPSAWPILVHCHGCMDRSPAWMGIYRFVVQGRPLDEILREIEEHRGSRPKASVTLLYNHALSLRAPERFANDPTARTLKAAAIGTADPYVSAIRERLASPNPKSPPAVTRK